MTGERTPDGFPIRRDWVAWLPRAEALVVYGHTPVREAMFRYKFDQYRPRMRLGGKLTALRYPELEIVQVSSPDRLRSKRVDLSGDAAGAA